MKFTVNRLEMVHYRERGKSNPVCGEKFPDIIVQDRIEFFKSSSRERCPVCYESLIKQDMERRR